MPQLSVEWSDGREHQFRVNEENIVEERFYRPDNNRRPWTTWKPFEPSNPQQALDVSLALGVFLNQGA